MKYWSFFLFVIILACKPPEGTHHVNVHEGVSNGDPGAVLILEMIDSLGGLEAYGLLQDVEYRYTYRDHEGLEDISIERYTYDGEKSWAQYDVHNKSVFPNTPGRVIQGFDGTESWTTIDGKLLEDERSVSTAHFLRKTNFYWFNMMFKLLDPGTLIQQKEDIQINGTTYHAVEVSFGEGVGDAKDIYLLFIHPETKLADKFLFTVMAFDRSDPLLMEVGYEESGGLKWPVYRRYTSSDWEGNIPEQALWTEEISENLRFNIGLNESLFLKPN